MNRYTPLASAPVLRRRRLSFQVRVRESERTGSTAKHVGAGCRHEVQRDNLRIAPGLAYMPAGRSNPEAG